MQTEMARQTEPSVNNALGGLLQGMLSRSDVLSENTQTITGHAGFHPDILIVDPGRSPVVIEAEYMPGANVEAEAKSRLGLDVAASGRRIEAVIALRYPDAVSDADDLRAALEQARLSYCVFTEERKGVSRFPESGWLDGSPEDVADLVRLVSVPQRAVDDATDTRCRMASTRRRKILDEMDTNRQAHHHGDCPPAGHEQRAADAPHGLRYHRQRPGLSRAHCRYAQGTSIP